MKTTITFIAIIATLGIAFLIHSHLLALLAGFALGTKLGETIFNIKI
jgi:hypothetical protein